MGENPAPLPGGFECLTSAVGMASSGLQGGSRIVGQGVWGQHSVEQLEMVIFSFLLLLLLLLPHPYQVVFPVPAS